MRRTTMNIRLLQLLTLSIILNLCQPTNHANASETYNWEKNNNWTVEFSNTLRIASPLFATLKLVDHRWEIIGLYNTPPEIPRTEKIELFITTRDLQRWSNFYINTVANCDSFEAKQADFHTVCTSALSEKQSARSAALGILFGGDSTRPVSYNKRKVTAAIQSIRIEQASEALSAFENGSISYAPNGR